ncbi:hypothetical protein, partial [Thermocrispum sp.]|uniref:2-oxoglutarate dehydrogenase E1 subunit family protein n=1 Tax=Thermocrispum sp. TaxID=2060768 RepID=UPI00257CB9AD
MVEEMYERFLADPQSVDAAWHDFFADFKPSQGSDGAATAKRQATTRTAPAPAGARQDGRPGTSQATAPGTTEPGTTEPGTTEP